MSDFPDIMTPEVQIAWEALADALLSAAEQKGVTLTAAAVTWAADHKGVTGFNCLFNEGMTEDLAEGMAGVLLMDADECDFEHSVEPVARQ